MKRTIVSILLILMMAVTMVGCASQEDKEFAEKISVVEGYIEDGKLDMAEMMLKDLIDSRSELTKAHVMLVELLMGQDRNREAKEFIDNSLMGLSEDDIKGDIVAKQLKEIGDGIVIPSVPVTVEIQQIDNSDFPNVKLYAIFKDADGNLVDITNIGDLEVFESISNMKSQAVIDDVKKVLDSDKVSINLVLDSSGSMDENNKMNQAKEAAYQLIDQIDFAKGDQVQLMSFDDQVVTWTGFDDSYSDIRNAVAYINTGGRTALYDALYSSIWETYSQSGAKCVIAFTDGIENASSYSMHDVIELSKDTGIPVYIIGIGNDCDENTLSNIAANCSGAYFKADVGNLTVTLSNIYSSIYREKQALHQISFVSSSEDLTDIERNILLKMNDNSTYVGEGKRLYIPKPVMMNDFSNAYANKAYMVPSSDQREISNSDLNGLSLAELRIARNEIFARHGRKFNDAMLNKWFYSKNWYLRIRRKYEPKEFSKLSPSPLSSIEINNVNKILEVENSLINQGIIFPNIERRRLTPYDLMLKKNVLKSVLNNTTPDPNNKILTDNLEMIEEIYNKADIKY